MKRKPTKLKGKAHREARRRRLLPPLVPPPRMSEDWGAEIARLEDERVIREVFGSRQDGPLAQFVVPRKRVYHCSPSFAQALKELGRDTWRGATLAPGPGSATRESVDRWKRIITRALESRSGTAPAY